MSHNFGTTTNFLVDTTDSFWSGLSPSQQTNVTNNANYLIGQVEAAFNTTTGWFGTDTTKFGTSNRQEITLDKADDSGAYNTGYGNPIHVDTQSNNSSSTAGPEVCMLWMAEWVEVLMSLTSHWNAGDSSGEGLSQYSANTLFLAGHLDYYGQRFLADWLNGGQAWSSNNQKYVPSPNAARSDWVNTTFTGLTTSAGDQIHGDGDAVSFGCALCFIYYLTVQLGFSINDVISSYTGTLTSCYQTLTGDNSNPFPNFLGLVSSVYPSGTPAALPSANPDDIFPIAEVQFYAQKDTFGLDETTDIIHTQGGLISQAFWVVVDGFSFQSFQSLGIQVGNFTGTFANLPGVTISPNPAGPQPENGVNATTPQQIRIPFDITLSDAPGNSILNQFPGTGVSNPYLLSVSLNYNGNTVSGSQATTEFELVAGADPYFTNIPAGQNNQPYLSQDLRVFQGVPAINQIPFPGGPSFSTDNPTGAYTYIKALLSHLNSTPAFTNPNGTDPFSLLPDQQGEGQTDSSVAPFALKTSGLIPEFVNNYNFALARVRLRGTSGSAGAAPDVRVFFRVFGTQSNDTDYDPNGTYASQKDAAGDPGTPLPGTGNTTIPFFATGNPGTETDYQPGGPNIQTITIPSGQDSVWWYFGCFLNFYDPAYQIANQQIQAYLPGTHHCLVAQIAFDEAPIPGGASPLSWDQLAQRNLQFTVVDNPGPAATHRAPQTFDCRPSGPIGQPGGTGLPPDELMIDWGNVPKGTVASLYWPAVSASDVIALAKQWGSTAPISASDAHTLSIPVNGGVSYIPIPSATGQNFAGLFTLELPIGIRTGQQFEVVVRRISTKRGKVTPPPPPPPQLQSPPSTRHLVTKKSAATVVSHAVVEKPLQWRYVVGSFVVRIPVSTGKAMLLPEAQTLAIMKWRAAHLSPSNRWLPVLERYIKYSSARLDGIGGNSSLVPPSLTWTPPLPTEGGNGGKGPEPKTHELCGKVAEVLFDCHGQFEGFVLDECCERKLFESRERGLSELVLRAIRENLTVCVQLCPKTNRIERLTIKW
jgi:hypothetical protein